MIAEELAESISKTLGMPTPRIERWDGWRSDANNESGVIRLRRDEANREDVVLHEVAHFAHYHFYLGPLIRGHGDGFCRSLVEVIQAAHRDPKSYPWTGEYRKVWKWAANQGLTTPPPPSHRGVVLRQGMLKARETIQVGDRVEWKHATDENGMGAFWDGTGVVVKIKRTRFLVSQCALPRDAPLYRRRLMRNAGGRVLVYAGDIKKVEAGS